MRSRHHNAFPASQCVPGIITIIINRVQHEIDRRKQRVVVFPGLHGLIPAAACRFPGPVSS